MKLTKEQWSVLEPLFPKKKSPRRNGGRPGYSTKQLLEGVLWVMKVGARWRDMPRDYPSGSTCYRHFRKWVEAGVFDKVIRTLVEDLRKRGKIDLTETFIDATFVEAKKGAKKSAKPSQVKVPKSWRSSTISLFLSPCLLRVLHHMRVDSLSRRFGPAILASELTDLSETKLTILMCLGKNLGDDFDANLLLPISAIENDQLKMADLLDATDEDGWSNDFLPGFNPFAV